MAGFGSVFAITLVSLMFTLAFSGIMGAMTNTVALMSSQKQNPSSVSVSSGVTNGTNTFLVNVTLAGQNHIRVSQIRFSDVFVAYVSDGVRRVFLVPYGSAADSWHIQRVFVGNREGDLCNPIDVGAGTGIWDPGETIELNITVSMPIDLSAGWYFSMTLADGGGCESAF